ncbi:MAG: glycosyltransferase, partial [Acidobacteriota bacterium]
MTWLAVGIFVGTALFIVYVVAGYPLLLRWLAPRPVKKQPIRKTVSVILPVAGGERWIAGKLESILALDYPRELVEILVVANGCRDRSAEIAAGFASRGVELLRLEAADKGLAINCAVELARGEILFFTDVRQKLDPASLSELVNNFADPEVGVVSGEVVILEGATEEEASVGLYRRYENWIRGQLSRIDSIFGATGCIWAMRRALAAPMPAGTLLDDMHLPLAAFFAGYRLVFDPSAKAFDYPTALDSEFRRKVRTLAGVYQVMGAYPALLGPANRMWIHFVSYKLARLLLPWALLAAAVSGFFLPRPWAVAAVGLQAVFYALAAADVWAPEGGALKRISSPARTFVVLMAAAACAGSVWFVAGGRLWKPTRVRPGRT